MKQPAKTENLISQQEIFSQEEIKIKKTLKNTTLSSLFLLLLSIFFLLEIKNYARFSQEQQSKLLTLKNQGQNTTALRGDYNTVKKEAEIINSSLPNKENIVDFVSSLETIALDYNFAAQLSFEKSLPQKDSKGLTFVPFKIQFTGSLDNLTNYLNLVEKLPYFVKISKITAQNLKGFAGTNQYFLEANLSIFQ